ncbi:hypothetical protein DSO57_1038356 [Entomophthora muscae]|uniref:Uncharacterized protein n=1 Tax=Entomophthora muscae TaxID=34485 RepID=A0ACC2SMV0_9FUNG|nr:hypothetical protein DSO57_1038356 [Entomophthora muscae]
MSLTAGFLDTSGKIFLSISTFVVVVGLGSCAVFIGWLKRKQNPESDNLEFFLTARSTQPALRVAWSFVAGGLGAWILTSPSSIAEDAGILGVVAYSVFAGLPIFLIAMVGARIQKALPKVLSFSDYIYHRFGIAPQFYVTLIVLLNLGVAMAAEYTAISAIFEACLGQDTYPIAIGLSIVTSAYTACGGLLVSILTDQYQAIFGSILLSIITMALATSFRPTLGPLPENLAPSSKGYHMLFIMPVTLTCSTVFSEAP